MTNTNNDKATELADLRKQMLELLGDAARVVRGTHEGNAAEAYWIAHIKTALGGSEYRTHATTMLNTIESLTDGECCAECGGPVENEDDELCDDCR